jgi:hypothetical protein
MSKKLRPNVLNLESIRKTKSFRQKAYVKRRIKDSEETITVLEKRLAVCKPGTPKYIRRQTVHRVLKLNVATLRAWLVELEMRRCRQRAAVVPQPEVSKNSFF